MLLQARNDDGDGRRRRRAEGEINQGGGEPDRFHRNLGNSIMQIAHVGRALQAVTMREITKFVQQREAAWRQPWSVP